MFILFFTANAAYDLYCNKCGIHLSSIPINTPPFSLLTTGEQILNKFKLNNSNSDKCTNTNCNTTFNKNTFTPNNTIKQATILFYYSGTALCYFVEHTSDVNFVYIIDYGYPEANKYPDFTKNLDDYTKAIKDNYIGKICTGGIDLSKNTISNCGARWVSAIYEEQNGRRKHIDVDDCTIKDW